MPKTLSPKRNSKNVLISAAYHRRNFGKQTADSSANTYTHKQPAGDKKKEREREL